MKNSIIILIGLSFLIISVGFSQVQTYTPRDTIRIPEFSDSIRQNLREDISNLSDFLFEMRIKSGSLDSLLKMIPIPRDFELDDQTFSIDGQKFQLKDLFKQPQPKIERQEIVKFGDDAVVGRNEWVNGDVIVFGGNAIVYGTVKGGIVVLKGDIRLTSTSYVKDDVICILGNTDIDEGARIAGRTSVFNFGKVIKDTLNARIFSSAMIIFRFLRIVLLFLIALLIYFAFPTQTGYIHDCLQKGYAKSFLVGFIGFFLLPVLFLVLLATIIGIPIALLLLPLVTLGAFLHGGTGFSILIGEKFQKLTGLKIQSKAVFIGIGIVLIELPLLLYKIFTTINSIVSAILLSCVIVVYLIVWTPGFGAVIVTRFGTRECKK
jgi:hypothetical protein